MQLNYREAVTKDIEALHKVRMSVKENVLNTPSLVKVEDYENFLSINGKGWLCEYADTIVGFAIIDTTTNWIWALFVHPDFEKKGIGKNLQKLMLDWHFSQSKDTLYLSTAPDTRADAFYSLTGWTRGELLKNGEVKFTMAAVDWGSR